MRSVSSRSSVLECDPKDLYSEHALSGYLTDLSDAHANASTVTRCQLIRTLPLYGTIAVGGKYFCFWRRNVLSQDLKIRIPMSDLEAVHSTRAFGFHVWGLAIQLTGAPDVRLDFHSKQDRDAALVALKKTIELFHGVDALATGVGKVDSHLSRASSEGSTLTSSGTRTPVDIDPEELEQRRRAPLGTSLNQKVTIPPGKRLIAKVIGTGPTCNKTITSRHFVLLTIGSRGDVQVYIVRPSFRYERMSGLLIEGFPIAELGETAPEARPYGDHRLASRVQGVGRRVWSIGEHQKLCHFWEVVKLKARSHDSIGTSEAILLL